PVFRTVENADPGVPELPLRRALETVEVDPSVVRTARVRLAAADAVRPLEPPARRLQRLAAAVGNREREPGARLEDAVDIPSAKDGVLHTFPVTSQLAPVAERKLVAGGHREVVTDVVRRGSVIPERVGAVQIVEALDRGLAPPDTVVPHVVTEGLAVGVGREELEALAGTLAEARLKGVVCAYADRVRAARGPDVRVQRIERASLVQRPPGVDGAWIGFGLVEVERHHHVPGPAPHVPHLSRQRVRQLALHEDVPLLRE